jgi:hypothetical protein
LLHNFIKRIETWLLKVRIIATELAQDMMRWKKRIKNPDTNFLKRSLLRMTFLVLSNINMVHINDLFEFFSVTVFFQYWLFYFHIPTWFLPVKDWCAPHINIYAIHPDEYDSTYRLDFFATIPTFFAFRLLRCAYRNIWLHPQLPIFHIRKYMWTFRM